MIRNYNHYHVTLRGTADYGMNVMAATEQDAILCARNMAALDDLDVIDSGLDDWEAVEDVIDEVIRAAGGPS